MEIHKKTFFTLVLICSILIILSQNFGAQGWFVSDFFDWSTYITQDFGRVWVCWQDSFFGIIVPFLAYFPIIAGVLGVISAFTVFNENEQIAKRTFKIAGLLAVLAFATFLVSGAFFGIISSELALPNLPGGYFCLIPGIIILILGIAIQKPEYAKGHAREDKEYFAIGGEERRPAPAAATGRMMECPNCGKVVSADQLFCEDCGQFF